jgi:hypothetical protein
MSTHQQTSNLAHVVELNECAKAILADTHQVNLRCLDAMVRSTRSGSKLRGFAEVSVQMRHWSRELYAGVNTGLALSAQQIGLMSAFVQKGRQVELLAAAMQEGHAQAALQSAYARVEAELLAVVEALALSRRKMRSALEDLEQLGLMACVLSRAALIEAASGNPAERHDLTIVSKEFADRSEKVTQTIRSMLASDRKEGP